MGVQPIKHGEFLTRNLRSSRVPVDLRAEAPWGLEVGGRRTPNNHDKTSHILLPVNCLTCIINRMNTEKITLFPTFKQSTQALREENWTLAMTAVAKFGWLRAREIGNVLWPNNQTRHVAGARLIRRLVKEKLLIERTLPFGFGTAVVLSKKGADFVNNETNAGQNRKENWRSYSTT